MQQTFGKSERNGQGLSLQNGRRCQGRRVLAAHGGGGWAQDWRQERWGRAIILGSFAQGSCRERVYMLGRLGQEVHLSRYPSLFFSSKQ